jgi:hypothetical protein
MQASRTDPRTDSLGAFLRSRDNLASIASALTVRLGFTVDAARDPEVARSVGKFAAAYDATPVSVDLAARLNGQILDDASGALSFARSLEARRQMQVFVNNGSAESRFAPRRVRSTYQDEMSESRRPGFRSVAFRPSVQALMFGPRMETSGTLQAAADRAARVFESEMESLRAPL